VQDVAVAPLQHVLDVGPSLVRENAPEHVYGRPAGSGIDAGGGGGGGGGGSGGAGFQEAGEVRIARRQARAVGLGRRVRFPPFGQ